MSKTRPENADNPGVIAPPPLIYAGALAVGLLANRRYHLAFLPRLSRGCSAAYLIAGGLPVGFSGFARCDRLGPTLTRGSPRPR